MRYIKLLIIFNALTSMLIQCTPNVYKYRVYCNTEAKNVFTWAESAPTTCPNNTAHTINNNSISIVDKIVSNEVKIQAESVPTGGIF